MKLNTVGFDDWDSFDDFELVLTSKTVGAPSIKTETVDVPGADGSLDLTEFFGEVFFENRELNFEFACKTEPYLEVYSYFKNKVHGKKMKIRLSDDPGFYYLGRVSINEWETDEGLGFVSVDVDAEPYKYRNEVTQKIFSVNGSLSVILDNLKKPVSPTFEVSDPINITFENKQYAASEGTYKNLEIILKAGENPIKFDGNGTVVVTYQERGL